MSDLLDENGFAKETGPARLYSYDPETGVYLGVYDTTLTKTIGLPANSTLTPPPEGTDGVAKWENGKWVIDTELKKKLDLAARVDQVNDLIETYEQTLSRLNLKNSMNKITDDEEKERISISHYLIDLYDFPIEDLEKEIPVYKP